MMMAHHVLPIEDKVHVINVYKLKLAQLPHNPRVQDMIGLSNPLPLPLHHRAISMSQTVGEIQLPVNTPRRPQKTAGQNTSQFMHKFLGAQAGVVDESPRPATTAMTGPTDDNDRLHRG